MIDDFLCCTCSFFGPPRQYLGRLRSSDDSWPMGLSVQCKDLSIKYYWSNEMYGSLQQCLGSLQGHTRTWDHMVLRIELESAACKAITLISVLYSFLLIFKFNKHTFMSINLWKNMDFKFLFCFAFLVHS